jgi:hypothetical protein
MDILEVQFSLLKSALLVRSVYRFRRLSVQHTVDYPGPYCNKNYNWKAFGLVKACKSCDSNHVG